MLERPDYGQENLILAGRCLVLGTLAPAFLASAILVRDEVVGRRRQRHVGRSHYE